MRFSQPLFHWFIVLLQGQSELGLCLWFTTMTKWTVCPLILCSSIWCSRLKPMSLYFNYLLALSQACFIFLRNRIKFNNCYCVPTISMGTFECVTWYTKTSGQNRLVLINFSSQQCMAASIKICLDFAATVTSKT